MELGDLNPAKKKIIGMLKIFNLFYSKKNKITLHELLADIKNPLIKTLHGILLETADNISPYLLGGNGSQLTDKSRERYKDMILTPGEFLLSIPYIDSAYVDLFTWAAHKFGKECRENPELWDYLEKNVKEPKLWYNNCWEDFKAESVEKINNGELVAGAKSERESRLVDDHNDLRLKEFAEKQKQIGDKHRHW